MNTEKDFERAKEIQEYINILENEIWSLMDYLPKCEPYVERKHKRTNLGGVLMSIFKRDDKTILKAKKENSNYNSKEFEITNDDIMALVKVRSWKEEQLNKEFKELTGFELTIGEDAK